MDWDAIYVSSLPAWQPAERAPFREGIYRVLVTTRDYLTATPLETAERFARWTGCYWCCWALTPDRAALAYFRGPADGYPWRHLELSDTALPTDRSLPC
jgi:hypothetical protein